RSWTQILTSHAGRLGGIVPGDRRVSSIMTTASPGPRSALPSPAVAVPHRLRTIRRTGLSIGVATGLYGLSFGALATASGLAAWQAMVLLTVMFAGGSQFAFIGVVGGGGSAFGAALASVLLGVINTLYGLILA